MLAAMEASAGPGRAMAGLGPLRLDPALALAPDPALEPAGYIVVADDGTRIHFLDWGPPDPDARATPPLVLLVHGLAGTAWSWAPVARRLHRMVRVVAADLRGHGLSDAPVEGYDEATLGGDLVAVAEGVGLEGPATRSEPDGPRVILAGHGFGAIVATWSAGILGDRCAGLLLVDGGWEALEGTTGLDADAYLREVEEPPEVLRSMRAYLDDRAAYDPATWDADQERAARAAVVELPVGRVELAIHDHVRVGSVLAMFGYDPVSALGRVTAPIAVLRAADDDGVHAAALRSVAAALFAAGRPPLRVATFPTDGHNLMRYRASEVAAAILALAAEPPP
jgi:pimeloyl-ACP methyl ester carboxylesterase